MRPTHLITQAGFKLMILLFQPPNCRGYRHTLLHHPSGVGVGIWGRVQARPFKNSQHRESTHTQEDEEWRRAAINPVIGTLDTFQGCFSLNWDSNCIFDFNICLLQANIWETDDPFGQIFFFSPGESGSQGLEPGRDFTTEPHPGIFFRF